MPPGYQRQLAGEASEAGSRGWARSTRFWKTTSGGREATAHGEADAERLRAGVRVLRRLHPSWQKDYVRTHRLRFGEMFVPLVHAPGEAQANFGEALVVVAGVERKAHYLAMDLPHSGDGFVAAFPAETTREAFSRLRPRLCLFWRRAHAHSVRQHEDRGGQDPEATDGRRRQGRLLRVAELLPVRGEVREPAKGNDKGKVEGLVGYVRRNFMVPVPRASSWEELNAHLEEQCRKRRQRRLRGHTETIGERFERDRLALLPLPSSPYEACEKQMARVSSPCAGALRAGSLLPDRVDTAK